VSGDRAGEQCCKAQNRERTANAPTVVSPAHGLLARPIELGKVDGTRSLAMLGWTVELSHDSAKVTGKNCAIV
jgi:hypothetical protein